MQEKLVELLNELLEDSKPSWRKLVGQLLTGPDSYFIRDVGLPEDLIVASVQDGVVRLSMLGIINTALVRVGDERKVIAVVDDEGLLQRVELGSYPVEKVNVD